MSGIENILEHIQVFTQNSIRIESQCGTIYLDPIEIPGTPQDADFILITHNHGDHFSQKDIEKIAKADTILIVPQKMAEQTEKLGGLVGKIETILPNEHRIVNGLEFETVPAYNNLKPFHPKKAGWVGYVLHLNDKRIYIAGDSDLTRENSAVQCDIAMVPIGGTFTMDAKTAAKLINVICPEVAIPTHYGSIVGKPEDAQIFTSLVNPPIRVVIKIMQ